MVDDNTPLNREILFYATPSGAVRVEVVFEEETFCFLLINFLLN